MVVMMHLPVLRNRSSMMSSRVLLRYSTAPNFVPRSKFAFSGSVNWYPGHMAKAMKEIKGRIRYIDAVLEIRDARIPVSSINPEFEKIVANKRRLVVYNKADLADPHLNKVLEDYKFPDNTDLLVTSALQRENIEKMVRWAGHNTNPKFKTVGAHILVTGVPNVGKSSIINAFRSLSLDVSRRDKDKKVAHVGGVPGITRQLNNIKVCDDPLVYVVDSPGVMVPRVKEQELGLRLALTGAVHDHLVGERVLADYLLYCLNRQDQLAYTKLFKLRQPTNHIDELLEHIAPKKRAKNEGERANQLKMCARHLLRRFRAGDLGRVSLDSETDINTGLQRNKKKKSRLAPMHNNNNPFFNSVPTPTPATTATTTETSGPADSQETAQLEGEDGVEGGAPPPATKTAAASSRKGTNAPAESGREAGGGGGGGEG